MACIIAAAAHVPPKVAILVAALGVGRPDIADDLRSVCERESLCTAKGVHEIDAHLSARAWWGQVRLGHLDPECQPYGKGKRWATHGALGLSAADHWDYLPPCYQPEALDNPMISAWVGAQKYLRHCDGHRGRRWCPRKNERRGGARRE